MRYPLSLPAILERAPKLYPTSAIVSRLPDGSIHRYTYREFYTRTRALAGALQQLGMRTGDRVATLCWSHYAHLEAYFGVPCAGGVAHTLNLRLHPHELAAIARHAQDRFLIADDCMLPLCEQLVREARFEKIIVVNHDGKPSPPGMLDYEELIASAPSGFSYPDLDENDAAAMCFTSGTTGNAKGVLYSHRALTLHAMAFALPDVFNISQHDVMMPIAPMFHANAHGVPHVALLLGCKLVFPGRHLDAPHLLELITQEGATFTTAVPTVWNMLLEGIEASPGKWKIPPRFRGGIGGTAAPESLVRRLAAHGIELTHLWGMTETTPIATTSTIKAHMRAWPQAEQLQVRLKQGRPLPFVDLRVVNEQGEVPWDGKTPGELQTRGPFVAGSYFNAPETADRWTSDGWLRTGDVATIDAEGYMQICDRAKDLIKSGGEWISSVDLENALAAHPAVREAGVVGVPHPKWDERPIAVVVLKTGMKATPEELRAFLADMFAKWQLPDAFIFVDHLPHTSTGKLSKIDLRKQYANWQWQTADAAR